MKYIKSKKISPQKYELTLEVSYYDLKMLESFATTYAPNEIIEEPSRKNNFGGVYSPDYKDKYDKWISKTWQVFWATWHEHDDPVKKWKRALSRLRRRNL